MQRRESNTVAFHHKQCEEYNNGFRDYRYNYWIGLERLHAITFYEKFSVRDESQNYKVTIENFSSSRSGSALMNGSLMNQYNGRAFSTPDRDNDGNSNTDCAQHAGDDYGGWWFGVSDHDCIDVNLNGEYYNIMHSIGENGIVWQGAVSLTDTIMAIKKV